MSRRCTYRDCDRKHNARGLCNLHGWRKEHNLPMDGESRRAKRPAHVIDDIAYIPLNANSGKYTMVDADNAYLGERLCYAALGEDRPYVQTWIDGRDVQLHRIIMDAPAGYYVDHINGDVLDNRRRNLRLATCGQNSRNCRRSRNNTTGYKGVYYRPKYGDYRAIVTCNRKRHHLGYFATPEEAARAYDKHALELHGAFASLNFPVQQEQ
jgi:hypothetical protein